MKWADFRENYYSLKTGQDIRFHLINSHQIILYALTGPSGVIGNDFGKVLGAGEIRFQLYPKENSGVVLGFSWGHIDVFHPCQFGYVKGVAGWKF